MHDFNSRIIKKSKLGKTKGTITFRILHEIKGEMSRNEIAVAMSIKPSRLAQPIFSLCNAGLLLKRLDKWHKRKFFYYRLPTSPIENQALKPFLCPRCLKIENQIASYSELCENCTALDKKPDKPERQESFGGELSLEYLKKPITGLKL